MGELVELKFLKEKNRSFLRTAVSSDRISGASSHRIVVRMRPASVFQRRRCATPSTIALLETMKASTAC